MGRIILFISILVAVMVIILSYVFTQSMLGHDTKILNVFNSTSSERTGANPIGQNTQISSVLPDKDNMERITSMPSKCLGSALCPD
jgi:hypothetical protein